MQIHQSPVSGKEFSRIIRKLNGGRPNLSQGKVRQPHISFLSQNQHRPHWEVLVWSKTESKVHSGSWNTEYKSQMNASKSSISPNEHVHKSQKKNQHHNSRSSKAECLAWCSSLNAQFCHLFSPDFCFQGTRMSLSPLFPVMYRAVLTSH